MNKYEPQDRVVGENENTQRYQDTHSCLVVYRHELIKQLLHAKQLPLRFREVQLYRLLANKPVWL